MLPIWALHTLIFTYLNSKSHRWKIRIEKKIRRDLLEGTSTHFSFDYISTTFHQVFLQVMLKHLHWWWTYYLPMWFISRTFWSWGHLTSPSALWSYPDGPHNKCSLSSIASSIWSRLLYIPETFFWTRSCKNSADDKVESPHWLSWPLSSKHKHYSAYFLLKVSCTELNLKLSVCPCPPILNTIMLYIHPEIILAFCGVKL